MEAIINFYSVTILIVALPLLAAIANGFNLVSGERFWGWRTVQRTTCGALFFSFVGASWIFWQILMDPTPREIIVYQWFAVDRLSVDVGFLIDSLSAIMMMVVTGFSFMIAVFSINYMHNDDSFSRYFSAMSLFVFSMLVLVMGNNYVMLFLGWEAVGLCSYLLIGHYYQRNSAARAGTKAFIMNRVGDAGFLVGIFLIATNFDSVAYSEVYANLSKIDTFTANAIGLCLLTGAIGKSAQLPLGTWLAKAMEGPTPSSALIHAATMVTAGVYMIARSNGIYDMAPVAIAAVTLVGALTAVYGATVGKTITDIKGILAASTTTQLGLMFVALGLGAYPVAIFHLVAHAFMKSFLFLTAPSILHYFHTFPQAGAVDERPGPVPVVFWLVLLGTVGLIAYPFGLGLFGDLEITGLNASYYVLIAAGIMALFTTLYYAISATQRIFGGRVGQPNTPIAIPIITFGIVLIIGYLLSLLPGGLNDTWFANFLAPVVNMSATEASRSVLSFGIIVAVGLLMISGWVAAIFMDRFSPELPGARMLRARTLYTAAMRRFWLDDFYHRVLVAGAVRFGKFLDRFDTNIIDRLVGTPAPAIRIRSASSTWEAQYIEAKAAGVTGVLGKLDNNTQSTADDKSDREKSGILSWLTSASNDNSAYGEKYFAAESTGIAGKFTAFASRAAEFFETDIIGQIQGFIRVATSGAAVISGWVEHNVFESGINKGVSQTGGALGRMLYKIEELMGHPLFVGTTVLAAIFGLLWGVVL